MDAAIDDLDENARLVRAQIDERFRLLVARMEFLAGLPLVMQLINSQRPGTSSEKLGRIFQSVVASDPILQTVNLHDASAACIASSIPSRVGMEKMQRVVSGREDFLSAIQGETTIKGVFTAASSGRPVIVVTVPVVHEGRIAGVLRAVIDVQWFGNKYLSPLWPGKLKKIFVFSPGLKSERSSLHDAALVFETPYKMPDIPLMIPDKGDSRKFMTYKREDAERLAVFKWMDQPRWLIVVETTLSEVLRPVNTVKYATWGIALGLFLLVWGISGLSMRPLLARLRDCSQMVSLVSEGNFNARVTKLSNDDIGDLAAGLNSMAERLQKQRSNLVASEKKYRSIFDNALEGIFQVTPQGYFLSANQAMLQLVKAGSLKELQQTDISAIYANPAERTAAQETLREQGRLMRFPFQLRRLDGETLMCLMHVALERDANGQITSYLGMATDVTAEKTAEAERERARQAEQLALQTRLGALRHQLNPHFIFNVLNTIDVLARRSPEKMTELLHKLFKYIRNALTSQQQPLTPLKNDLDAVRVYLEIESVRFRENLRVDFRIAPETSKLPVPDMLLQPVVENAIKHGMKTSELPLQVIVESSLQNATLSLLVKNSGKLIKQQQSPVSPQVGLANLRERLHLLYGTSASLAISENAGWVEVSILLPASA